MSSSRILYLLLAVTGILTTVVIWKSNQAASDLQTKLNLLTADGERLNSKLEDLKKQENELAAAEGQSEFWRRQLQEIYGQYRTVEDFAPNPSNFIIWFGYSMDGTKRFSVPDGEHTLKVDVSKINQESEEVISQNTMSYDLIENAAYVLQLDHSKASRKKAAPLKLLLTSNAEEFKSISEDILTPFSSARGSRSGHYNRIISFPNEIARHLPMNRWEDSFGKGVVLADFTWSVETPEQDPIDLNFKFRIVSEGPYVVSSGTTYTGKYRVEYLRNGMFEVLKNSE